MMVQSSSFFFSSSPTDPHFIRLQYIRLNVLELYSLSSSIIPFLFSHQVSGGMVGASKLSELIYGKEVPSNDSSSSSPYHGFIGKQVGLLLDPSSSGKICCSTGHKVSRCHGTRLLEGVCLSTKS